MTSEYWRCRSLSLSEQSYFHFDSGDTFFRTIMGRIHCCKVVTLLAASIALSMNFWVKSSGMLKMQYSIFITFKLRTTCCKETISTPSAQQSHQKLGGRIFDWCKIVRVGSGVLNSFQCFERASFHKKTWYCTSKLNLQSCIYMVSKNWAVMWQFHSSDYV